MNQDQRSESIFQLGLTHFLVMAGHIPPSDGEAPR
jgi:hypothetical protein